MISRRTIFPDGPRRALWVDDDVCVALTLGENTLSGASSETSSIENSMQSATHEYASSSNRKRRVRIKKLDMIVRGGDDV